MKMKEKKCIHETQTACAVTILIDCCSYRNIPCDTPYDTQVYRS